MRTDYAGHDSAYRKRKADGKPGWSSNADIAETRRLFQEDLSAWNLPRQGKLLELGCGDGANLLWLAEMGYEVSGVDIAPFALEWAREKLRDGGLAMELQVGNVLDLAAYADNSFDMLFDGHCLHCIIGDDRALCLKSALRVLKPGGMLYVNTMSGEVTGAELLKNFDPKSRYMVYQGDLATRYIGMAEDIVEEVRLAGFHVMNWRVNPRKDLNDQDSLLLAAVKS